MILEYSRMLRYALPTVVFVAAIAMFWSAAEITKTSSAKLLYAHPYIYSNVTSDSLFFGQSNALFGCIAGAIFGLIFSLVGCAGAWFHSRIAYGVFVFFAWIAALAMLVSGALFLNSLAYLGNYATIDGILQNPNNAVNVLSTAHTNMLDMGISIYNECCVNKSYVEQGLIGVCTGDNTVDCPTLTNPLVSKYANPVDLCTCGHSTNSINMYTQRIREWGVCNLMQSVYINLNGAVVPILKIPIQDMLTDTYGTVDLSVVPIVGFHKDPSYYSLMFGKSREAPKYGFGCGFGYVKGTLWYINAWYQNSLKPIANWAIILGTIQIVSLCVVFF